MSSTILPRSSTSPKLLFWTACRKVQKCSWRDPTTEKKESGPFFWFTGAQKKGRLKRYRKVLLFCVIGQPMGVVAFFTRPLLIVIFLGAVVAEENIDYACFTGSELYERCVEVFLYLLLQLYIDHYIPYAESTIGAVALQSAKGVQS
jgi:hypothetical protein